MSHTTIYFLTEANDFDQAEHRVTEYLETEHFFDSFNILPDESGSLKEKRQDIDTFIDGWNWRKSADDILNLAEKYKSAGNLAQYGYHLVNAGQLYAQYLTVETYAFNIDTGDYTIPADDAGWQIIAVDFHY
jgi:hypothetical protein